MSYKKDGKGPNLQMTSWEAEEEDDVMRVLNARLEELRQQQPSAESIEAFPAMHFVARLDNVGAFREEGEDGTMAKELSERLEELRLERDISEKNQLKTRLERAKAQAEIAAQEATPEDLRAEERSEEQYIASEVSDDEDENFVDERDELDALDEFHPALHDRVILFLFLILWNACRWIRFVVRHTAVPFHL